MLILVSRCRARGENTVRSSAPRAPTHLRPLQGSKGHSPWSSLSKRWGSGGGKTFHRKKGLAMYTSHLPQELHTELFPQINFSGNLGGENIVAVAFLDNHAFIDNTGAIGDFKGIANVVVSNKNTNALPR